MNVVFILIDSLNRHYLSPYGCETVKTPNIGELASRGVTFTNHFIGSASSMPARREMMAGRQEFLWKGWAHLEPFDEPVARKARDLGAVTQITTDHYHYWENGAHGYIEHFNGCELIRGNEFDAWITAQQTSEPDWVKAINRHRPGAGSRYYRNVASFKDEDDFFSPKVFKAAADWIDANHAQEKFFLQIETLDTHEPFHIPEPYRSMYTDDLNPAYTCWPPYQDQEQRLEFLRNTSMGELAYIRAQYQGKVTMLDNALGTIWSAMDRHKLWDNTMVIFLSDHGHDLAEAIISLDEIADDARDHTLRIPFGKQHPHYLSHANSPLIVWHPERMNGGKQVDAITSAVDMYSTVLDGLGSKSPSGPHSRSILPLLSGETRHRDLAYWGTFGEGICCTDGEYVLLQGAKAGVPLHWYSTTMEGACANVQSGKFIPDVDCPVWQHPIPSRFEMPSIFYRRDEPLFRERNIIGEELEAVANMRKRLRDRISEDGCPPEQFDRLSL